MPARTLRPPGLADPPGAGDLDPAYADDPLCRAPSYRQGVQVGDTVYVAGQVAFDAEMRIVGAGDPVAQAEQTWDNVARVVEAAGGRVTDVVKVTVFLADMAHATAEMAVRQRRFGGAPPPVVTLVQAAALALPELLMEIDAVAVVGAGPDTDNQGGPEHGD